MILVQIKRGDYAENGSDNDSINIFDLLKEEAAQEPDPAHTGEVTKETCYCDLW